MAKDPAFLFYYQDWMVGTRKMTKEQKGYYVDLLCEQADQGYLTSEDLLDVPEKVLKKFTKKGDKFYNQRLKEEVEKRKNFCESRRKSRMKSNEDEVRIYMIRDYDTKYTKIGSSVNPTRRLSEMINQKNPAITVGERRYQLIWYSIPTSRKNEHSIQEKFKHLCVTGEWFNLSQADIKNIKSLLTTDYEDSYQKRTYARTENKDEDGDSPSFKSLEDRGVGEETKIWRDDFSIYKAEEMEVYQSIISDRVWIQKHSDLNPGLDILRTLKKAHENYWSQEIGWKNKKKSKSQPDWKRTFQNSLDLKMNRIWKDKESEWL